MIVSVEADLLKTLPCVGKILSMVLMQGSIQAVVEHAWGRYAENVNRNLKWAFVEIGNLIVINQRRMARAHVVQLYRRIKRAKNHQKAVVAVARHFAEAAWWVLTKQESYRDPRIARQTLSSTHG
jgi:hypothetical protein